MADPPIGIFAFGSSPVAHMPRERTRALLAEAALQGADLLFFETADFLNSGPLSAVQVPLKDFVAGGRVIYSANEVVFKEAASTLYDGSGQRIESW